MRFAAGCLALCLAVAPVYARPASPEQSQLQAIRTRIRALQTRLERLHGKVSDAAAERDRLKIALELARARVQELELQLTHSRDEILRLRKESDQLAEDLASRREVLAASLQMAALLGRPGSLRLFVDSVRGGDLEQMLDSVTVLTAGQARLMQEYEALRLKRRERLGKLSRTMEIARAEADSLEARRRELTEVEHKAEERLKKLERQERRAQTTLDDLNERAAALERLMVRLEGRTRLEPDEDIRRYRGALPWPAVGRIAESFGRHRLPQYATYTVCNGIRLDVPSGTRPESVFPGEVAFARYFKGYGNTVVLDHGHGVYSVTAGLATILVRVGQRVPIGAAIGVVGKTASGGNLYFEIRAGGRAVNPLHWLQLKEGGH